MAEVIVSGRKLAAVLADIRRIPAHLGYAAEVALAGQVTRAEVARQLQAALKDGTASLDARAAGAIRTVFRLDRDALPA